MKKNKGKKESVWKKAVASNTEKQTKQASKLGYFMLPKNVKLFKETPGSKVRLDFLPYIVTDPNHPDKDEDNGVAVVGSQWYKRPFRIHRGIGVNNEYVVCPTSIGKRCPICEYRAKRQKEGAPKEELTALNATHRNLYIVIPKDAKDFDEVPHVWEISQFLFQDKLNEEIQEDEDNACFPALDEGKTVRIRFTEETFMKNKYADVSRIDFEDRDEYPESLLKTVPNLDEVLQILTYKELEAKFYEVVADADEEEEKEKSTPRKKTEIKSLDEDEDEDIDEDEDEEEEEEEVKPAPKKKGRPSKKVVEEEDDEDEDIDEEQDDEDEEIDDDDDDDEGIDDDDDEDEDEEEVPPKGMVKVKCVACGGTGKNSKGGVCSPCKGKGYKLVPSKKSVIEDDDDEEETPTPKKSKGKENKCPYKHTFGEDTDSFDDCNHCKVWQACYDANDA